MANEKRLIQQMAERLIKAFPQGDRNNPCPFVYYETFTDIVWDIADQMVDALEDASTVDAVEVYRIEEAKQAILQTFDNLIAIHRDISNSQFANSAQYLNIPESSNDYNGIYADAMEVARRFINAALTDLCNKNGRWNENG